MRTSSPAAIAHAWVDAANRQDGDALVSLSSPDIEIIGPRGAVRGASVLRDWLTRAGLTLENKRTFARGSTVVIEQHGVWRSVETGAFVGEADVASRFEVKGAHITTFERFDDLGTALAAAGLTEADKIERL